MSYFIASFDPTDTKDVMGWIREDHDPYDQWGWAKSWLFDLAGELYNRNIRLPELGYRPGIFGVDISEDREEGLSEIADEPLIYAAKVLNRFADLLDKAGESY